MKRGRALAATDDRRRDSSLIRVLVVDDHGLVREALVRLLEDQDDMEVIGVAADGAAAVREARRHRPDVVLMDVRLPVMTGVEATRVLHRELPHTGIVAFSMCTISECGHQMFEAGADAYVEKSSPPFELLEVIRTVAD